MEIFNNVKSTKTRRFIKVRIMTVFKSPLEKKLNSIVTGQIFQWYIKKNIQVLENIIVTHT